MGKKKRAGAVLSFSLLILAGLNSPSAWGQEVFQTQRAVVQADSATDLMEMERKLQFFVPATAAPLPTRGALAYHPASPRLAAKIDGLLDQVCHVLKVRPANPPQLRIILLKNGKEVKKRHLLFVAQERPSFFGYGSLEGFYEARSHTIFLSLADLHEGILAHEMTHFVLCASFPAPPPTEEQEAWARYVESRL
jgi:hypothetical protein